MFAEVSDAVLAGIIGAITAPLLAAIVAMWKVGLVRLELQDAEYRRQITLLSSDLHSWRTIATEALVRAEGAARIESWITGKPIASVIAPVVPEHSSPETSQQISTAEIATARARLVALSIFKDQEKEIAAGEHEKQP